MASLRSSSGLSDTNSLSCRAISSTDRPFLIVLRKSCSSWAYGETGHGAMALDAGPLVAVPEDASRAAGPSEPS